MPSPYRLLQLALCAFGAVSLLLYPLAVVWPSGWAWHDGAPHESQYFMMIVGMYATLGVCLLNAARSPGTSLSLIWFSVWSSVVHAVIMTVQSFGDGDHTGHLRGDVPALLAVAIVLAVLVRSSGLTQRPVRRLATGGERGTRPEPITHRSSATRPQGAWAKIRALGTPHRQRPTSRCRCGGLGPRAQGLELGPEAVAAATDAPPGRPQRCPDEQPERP